VITHDVHEWVARQTWPNVNAIAHDTSSATRESWGKYVCVASSDLLAQPETYLETNIILLEREECAFSINLKAMPVWITLQMQQQLLPGSLDHPLLRQVARTCCVNDRLQIDISTWLRDRQNQLVNESITLGYIIRWTTNETERFSSLPMQSHLEAGNPFRLDEQRLITTAEEPQIAGAPKKRPANALFAPPAADDPRPTVLVFMPFLAVGGAERVALDVVQHLRFVVVATDPHDAALGTTADRFRQLTPFVYTAHDFLAHDQAGAFLAYLINRYSPQCLYIANGSGWLYDALPQIKASFPHLRIANQVYDHQAGWINRCDATLARTIDSHIGVNAKICEAYVRAGVPAENTHLIEHGIDIAEFDPARYDTATIQSLKRALNVPDQLKVVTFIARLHPQKRPMDFVAVARQMRDEAGVCFLMVGDGPLAGQVNDEANRMNLKNFIRRSFYQPSRDIFAISDVIVLPSEYEGMPVTILEAQSMGKPVVVTDVGNTRDVLALTQGGVVVSRIGDVNALREGVMQALRMQIEVKSTRAKLDAHFGAPIIAARYLRALLGRET
jgi:glycosyltransferase involved in cell wall biosynthesis